MYLSPTTLRDLCDFETEAAAISLYIYSSPQETADHFADRLNRLAESVTEQIEAFQGPISHWMTQGKHLEQLKEALLDVFVEDKDQTCCVFIAEDRFIVVDLPLPSSEFVVVDHRFFTAPLTGMLAQFERYAVLVCDQNRARLFGIHLNEIEEQEGIFADYTLPEHNLDMPAWECLSEEIPNQRLRDPFHRHLKNVADRLRECFDAYSFDRLLIGAPESQCTALRHHLPRELQNRLLGTIDADINNHPAAIRHKAEPLIHEHRRRREVHVLAELQQGQNQQLVVLGARSVTKALMTGQAKRLVISSRTLDKGWACPLGHLIGGPSSKSETCPWCHQDLEPIQSLGESLLVEAISQQVDIFHVLHEKDTWEGQSIGAFLRYPLKPK
ncbi:host attachment protein [Planctomycetota bacterium]